jgi:hypothetical protein
MRRSNKASPVTRFVTYWLSLGLAKIHICNKIDAGNFQLCFQEDVWNKLTLVDHRNEEKRLGAQTNT